MVRFLFAAVIVAALLFTSARAQTTLPAFVAVDGFTVSGATISVRGVEEGAQEPSGRSATFVVPNVAGMPTVAEQMRICKELVLLAMAKPGQYRLSLVSGVGITPATCGLTRVNP